MKYSWTFLQGSSHYFYILKETLYLGVFLVAWRPLSLGHVTDVRLVPEYGDDIEEQKECDNLKAPESIKFLIRMDTRGWGGDQGAKEEENVEVGESDGVGGEE